MHRWKMSIEHAFLIYYQKFSPNRKEVRDAY